MAKYNEAMERLTLDPAARTRILEAAQSAEQPAARQRGAWRRWAAIAAVLAVVLIGAIALLPKRSSPEPTEPEDQSMQAGYFTEEYDSAAALSEAMGFEVEDLGSLPMELGERTYLNICGEIAEETAQSGTQTLCYRKSSGSEDNSGVYEEFTAVKTVETNGVRITLKGADAGFLLALWEKDGYSFSLSLSEPISEQSLCSLAEALLR